MEKNGGMDGINRMRWNRWGNVVYVMDGDGLVCRGGRGWMEWMG